MKQNQILCNALNELVLLINPDTIEDINSILQYYYILHNATS